MSLCFQCAQPADYKCLACCELVCTLCAPRDEHTCGETDPDEEPESIGGEG